MRALPPIHHTLALLLALPLAGCPGDDDAGAGDDDDTTTAGDDDDTTAGDTHLGIALREDGWVRGDLHLHTTHSDGFDDVATTVALAEYFAHPDFLAYHPEYEGNELDFIAITDHRTAAVVDDPDFVSDSLILIAGEEFGGDGHAGCLGIYERVDHDPDGDGVTQADIDAAIEHAHSQGALFSPNHPMSEGIPFRWDVRDHDAVEIWNAGWAVASPPATPDGQLGWEASHGPVSPFFDRAMRREGVLAETQGLTLYEAMVARGVHVAMIGGSDRHAFLQLGSPTTYVRADAADGPGVLDGIRARHSFVARNPAAAQVLAEVTADGVVYELGDAIPIPPDGAEVHVRVRVARAPGGVLRVIGGGAVDDDEGLADAALGETWLEESIDGPGEVSFELTREVRPGDWLYPLVLEPLVPDGTPAELAELVHALAAGAAESGDDPMMIAATMAPAIDLDNFDPADCDPAAWRPDRVQCVTIIEEGLGTYFVPDLLDRSINVWVDDGQITDWCAGAVGSAVRFVEAE